MRFLINQLRVNSFQPSAAFHVAKKKKRKKKRKKNDCWELSFVENYCLRVLSGDSTKRLGVYI